MSKAEEGGNQPVKTLLIGGTKHGEWINLPAGQTEWELVEANILAGIGYSPGDPRYIGNIYALDQRLTNAYGVGPLGVKKGVQVFTHACLREPENGGRYPQLLRAETEAHEKYKKLYEAAVDECDEIHSKAYDLEGELDDVASELVGYKNRAYNTRRALEAVMIATMNAVDDLAEPYDPMQVTQ